MWGKETTIFTSGLAVTFFEQERIRIDAKRIQFRAMTDILPTASFAFASHEDPNKWILIVDNATDPKNDPKGVIHYYRHFIEDGHTIVQVLPLKQEIDAAVIYRRRKTYSRGL